MEQLPSSRAPVARTQRALPHDASFATSVFDGPGDSHATVSPATLLRILRRNVWLVVGCAAAGLTIAVLAALALPKEYLATGKVAVTGEGASPFELSAPVSRLGPEEQAVRTEIDRIQSADVLRRVIAVTGLMNDPAFNPAYNPVGNPTSTPHAGDGGGGSGRLLAGWLGDLRPREWMDRAVDALADWLPASVHATLFGDAVVQEGRDPLLREQAQVVATLRRNLSVNVVPRSYVIDVAFSGPHPEQAAKIVNALLAAYLERQVEQKLMDSGQANDLLGARVEDLAQKLSQAEQAVQAYREQQALVEADGTSPEEQQLIHLTQLAAEARGRRLEVEAQHEAVQGFLAQHRALGDVPEAMGSPLIEELQAQQAELQRQYAELADSLGPRHPARQKVEAQLGDVTTRIQNEGRRLLRTLATAADVARSEEQALRQEMLVIRAETQLTDRESLHLRVLEREAEALRVLYTAILTRHGQAYEQEKLATPHASILSWAEVPLSPSGLNAPLLALVGLLAGASAGVGLAFGRESFDTSFRCPTQMRMMTGRPVIASLPLIRTRTAGDVPNRVVDHPLDVFSESVNGALAHLRHGTAYGNLQVVVVASASPGDGKTSVSASLARMAAAQQRVLLLDTDSRRSSLAKVLGLKTRENQAFLADILAGACPLRDAIVRDPRSRLHVLLAGSHPFRDGPRSYQRLKLLLEQVRTYYDFILVDTPPMMMVTDGVPIVRLGDASLLVVRWGKTPRDQVQEALHRIHDFGGPPPALVLNAVDLRKQRHYARGDSAYYYQSCDGYFSEGRPLA